jgi:hypothetical protein
MALKDDDPLWERHSGGDAHRGPEWGAGDSRLAVGFYRSLGGNARLIFDLLMDQPGEQVDADWLAAQIPGPVRGGTSDQARPRAALFPFTGGRAGMAPPAGMR